MPGRHSPVVLRLVALVGALVDVDRDREIEAGVAYEVVLSERAPPCRAHVARCRRTRVGDRAKLQRLGRGGLGHGG